MGSQRPSPNVKNPLRIRAENWLEIITSRDAKSACFQGSQTSCTEIISGIFWPKFGQKRSHHVMGCVLLMKIERFEIAERQRNCNPKSPRSKSFESERALLARHTSTEIVETPLKFEVAFSPKNSRPFPTQGGGQSLKCQPEFGMLSLQVHNVLFMAFTPRVRFLQTLHISAGWYVQHLNDQVFAFEI